MWFALRNATTRRPVELLDRARGVIPHRLLEAVAHVHDRVLVAFRDEGALANAARTIRDRVAEIGLRPFWAVLVAYSPG